MKQRAVIGARIFDMTILAVGIILATYALYRLVADYWMGTGESDFTVYYAAAERWLGGTSLYVAGQGFIYPPPAVMLFVPLTTFSCHAAYIVFSALSYVFLAGSLLMLRAWFRAEGVSVTGGRAWVWVVLVLALAPTFENAAWGQVNTIVLFCAVAFFLLQVKGCWRVAGAILAVGTWLKIYPALLLLSLVWAERQTTGGRVPEPGWHASAPEGSCRNYKAIMSAIMASPAFRTLEGFLLGLILVPLVLYPLLSPDAYYEFIVRVLPDVSGIAAPRLMNQSVIGALVRWSLGPVVPTLNIALPLDAWIELTNKILFLAALIGLTFWARREPAWQSGGKEASGEGATRGGGRSLRAKVLLLACIPVFSPFGWSYTYVMTYPLILWVSTMVRGRFARLMSVGCGIALMVPAHHVIPLSVNLPVSLSHLVYSRYLLAVALLALIVVRTHGRRYTLLNRN